ncbi:tRNA (adenosine(37)-N6)-threonylcarbamoyltransferase complex ATPase subunit type 1 TsaE [Candidatus Dependentiae bacterium]
MGCDKNFTYGLSDIPNVVQYLKDKFNDCRIFVFYGPLGAGKTTLIRELLKNSGVKDVVTSPTFTYLNLYKNDQGQQFCHFDLYRLSNVNDFLGAGFDEYLNDEEIICFIEWPEVIEPLLKSGVCKVKIDYSKDANNRVLSVSTD